MKPEKILSNNKKYHELKNLVLICEAMEEFANAKLNEAINLACDVSISHEDLGLKIMQLKSNDK